MICGMDAKMPTNKGTANKPYGRFPGELSFGELS